MDSGKKRLSDSEQDIVKKSKTEDNKIDIKDVRCLECVNPNGGRCFAVIKINPYTFQNTKDLKIYCPSGHSLSSYEAEFHACDHKWLDKSKVVLEGSEDKISTRCEKCDLHAEWPMKAPCKCGEVDNTWYTDIDDDPANGCIPDKQPKCSECSETVPVEVCKRVYFINNVDSLGIQEGFYFNVCEHMWGDEELDNEDRSLSCEHCNIEVRWKVPLCTLCNCSYEECRCKELFCDFPLTTNKFKFVLDLVEEFFNHDEKSDLLKQLSNV